MATAITGDTACMENDFDSDVFSECDSDSSDDLPLTDIISRIQDCQLLHSNTVPRFKF